MTVVPGVTTVMMIGTVSWYLCPIPNLGEAAYSPSLKVLHQHKHLNSQGEKTVSATIAHFKFCTRTRKHAEDRGPLAETLQSCEVLPGSFAMCRKAQRKAQEADKGSQELEPAMGH